VTGWAAAILVLAELGFQLAVLMVILLRRRLDPNVRLAWVMLVVLLPLIGPLLYLVFGEVRLGSDRLHRHKEAVKRSTEEMMTRPSPGAPRQISIPDPYQQIAALGESVGGDIPTGGNRLKLFGDPIATTKAIIEDIDRAQSHCHILTYIFLNDQTGWAVAEALIRAEKRGVQCRLLVDAVGSSEFLRTDWKDKLRAAGVQVVAALPVSAVRALFARIDLRNHRKLVVIDGELGYTGSRNIADAAFAPKRRFAPWVDAMVRIEGPVVRDLQMLFVEDWFVDTDEFLDEYLAHEPRFFEDGVVAQVIGTGPNAYNFAMRQVSQAAIHLAREELILTTPYFVPDDATHSALMTAARRGVTTEIVLPARNDSRLVAAASRSYYEPLLESGVIVHEYSRGLLHAKTLTIDRSLALVTSANLDKRSFFLNFECSLVVYDADFASHLRFLQKEYISNSIAVDAARWKRRRWPKRLWHNAAGMLGPLL
jgi:cardiolipin synthase